MDKTKQPGIKFDGIILVEESFWRDYSVSENLKVDLEFSTSNKIEDNDAIVEVTTNFQLIKDDKSFVKLNFKFVGFFSIMEENPNMNMEKFISNNSLALMFPYIREHITSVTSKSGIKPIMLPPINLKAIVKK